MVKSIKNLNFVFSTKIDDMEFEASGSLFSGHEQIKINGELLSQKRSFALHRCHIFSVQNVDYRVDFQLRRFWLNTISVMVFSGRELIYEDEIAVSMTKNGLIFLLATALIGVIMGWLLGRFL